MVYFISIIGYLVLLSFIGIYKSRQVKTEDDFEVAGRSLSPWIMVCTMLAVWIGTGSIVGNAEKTYETGLAALIIPFGTFFGMILLSMIASKARSIEANTVPEIIGRRFGQTARSLAVISLIIAYMVIVSYQFNAGGAVLEVITGDHPPVTLEAGDEITEKQLRKGRVVYRPEQDWEGTENIVFTSGDDRIVYEITVTTSDKILDFKQSVVDKKKEAYKQRNQLTSDELSNSDAIKINNYARIKVNPKTLEGDVYQISSMPANGTLDFVEPVLTAEKATIIAAVFIIGYTMLAGLMSLAYADILTGSLITIVMIIATIVYWVKTGGWSGLEASYAAMGDRPQHMQFWGVYSIKQIINYLLPVFLLVLGDANQYQRIFASKSAKGARSAVITMIFAALFIELLIIFSAFLASSLVDDPENGKYILIFAAKEFMPLPLGCLFMVTVIGIITSTANSFLLVPSTTFIRDVYVNFINPNVSSKKVLILSRLMILVFGIIGYLVTRMFADTTGFFSKALFAFTIYGASITPSVVAAIVWSKATKAGSISSILVGVIIALVWNQRPFLEALENIEALKLLHGLDAVLPAIFMSVLCLVVVSLLTQPAKETATPKE